MSLPFQALQKLQAQRFCRNGTGSLMRCQAYWHALHINYNSCLEEQSGYPVLYTLFHEQVLSASHLCRSRAEAGAMCTRNARLLRPERTPAGSIAGLASATRLLCLPVKEYKSWSLLLSPLTRPINTFRNRSLTRDTQTSQSKSTATL